MLLWSSAWCLVRGGGVDSVCFVALCCVWRRGLSSLPRIRRGAPEVCGWALLVSFVCVLDVYVIGTIFSFSCLLSTHSLLWLWRLVAGSCPLNGDLGAVVLRCLVVRVQHLVHGGFPAFLLSRVRVRRTCGA